jgi:hypothetical protein
MLSRLFNNTYYEANEDMKCSYRFECFPTRIRSEIKSWVLD